MNQPKTYRNYKTKGAQLTTSSGNRKACLILNGSDEKITLASAITLTKPFSFNVWIYPDNVSNKALLGNTAGSNNSVYIASANRTIYRFGATATTVDHNCNFGTGAWSMYTFTVAADGTITTYKNTVASLVTGNNTSNLVINELFCLSSATYLFDGNVDEVSIFNALISETDRTTLYGGGTPQTAGTPPSANLILYYKFEDSALPIITDNSISGNTGTGVNIDSTNLLKF